MNLREAMQAMFEGKKVKIVGENCTPLMWSEDDQLFMSINGTETNLNYFTDDLFEIYTPPFKIEAGKWYKTRDGRKLYVIGLLYSGTHWGCVLSNDSSYMTLRDINGRYFSDSEPDHRDLVEECEAP